MSRSPLYSSRFSLLTKCQTVFILLYWLPCLSIINWLSFPFTWEWKCNIQESLQSTRPLFIAYIERRIPGANWMERIIRYGLKDFVLVPNWCLNADYIAGNKIRSSAGIVYIETVLIIRWFQLFLVIRCSGFGPSTEPDA